MVFWKLLNLKRLKSIYEIRGSPLKIYRQQKTLTTKLTVIPPKKMGCKLMPVQIKTGIYASVQA